MAIRTYHQRIVWRGDKEIRDTATLRRLSDIGPCYVIEAMLAAQMVATHEAAMDPNRERLPVAGGVG